MYTLKEDGFYYAKFCGLEGIFSRVARFNSGYLSDSQDDIIMHMRSKFNASVYYIEKGTFCWPGCKDTYYPKSMNKKCLPEEETFGIFISIYNLEDDSQDKIKIDHDDWSIDLNLFHLNDYLNEIFSDHYIKKGEEK